MTVRFYNGSLTTGLNDGTSWSNAYQTFGAAIAALLDGDELWVSDASIENAGAFSWSIPANAKILVMTPSGETGGTLSVQDGTTAYISDGGGTNSIGVNAGKSAYVYGLYFVSDGTGSNEPRLGYTDQGHLELEKCKFDLSAGGAGKQLTFGQQGDIQSYLKTIDCEVIFGNAGQYMLLLSAKTDMIGFKVSGTATTQLFGTSNKDTRSEITFHGCDWSNLTSTTTIVPNGGTMATTYKFYGCDIGGATKYATQTGATNMSSCEAYFINCSSADQHYHFSHHTAHGSTNATINYYADDGAKHDGTEKFSWEIQTTSHASKGGPYRTPWMSIYNDVTTAQTLTIEAVRDDLGTAYKDSEVWVEIMYPGTASKPMVVHATDRAIPDSTEATHAAGAATWQNIGATNAEMKLFNTSITCQVKGMIFARVCVGVPSIGVTDFWVDPQIRLA